jgi:LysR family glycine cleavage system transcriptional activator
MAVRKSDAPAAGLVPPLRAVQVFEAVGRCGAVTAAAEELGVSPGAVTQQIQALERYFGVRLVQRSGRGIELTRWGAIYLPHATAALEQLRRGGKELDRARRSNHLSVSTFPSITNRWLGPLLFDWKKIHPDSNILIAGSEAEPRLEENEADFRISYGKRLRCHQRSQRLFTDYVFPVASPALLARTAAPKRPSDLLHFPLLWVDWGPDHVAPPSWSDWLTACGVAVDEVPCALTFSLSSAALDAAVEGRGLMLAQHSMVGRDLATGTLVRLFDRSWPLLQPYFLAWNGAALDKPQGVAFLAWLVNEARRFDCETSRVG